MNDISLSAALASIQLFEGVSQRGLDLAKAHFTLCDAGPGELIVVHTDTSRDAYFLLQGRARAVLFSRNGRKIGLRQIETGDVFGELSAIDGQPRSASVEAITACWSGRLPAVTFADLMQSEPRFSANLIAYLVAMNRTLTTRVYEFSTLAVNNRIQAELLRMAMRDLKRSGRPWIDPAPTHDEIAGRVSTHREAVTRELTRLKRQGLLQDRGSAWVVTDLETLSRLVHDAADA